MRVRFINSMGEKWLAVRGAVEFYLFPFMAYHHAPTSNGVESYVYVGFMNCLVVIHVATTPTAPSDTGGSE